MIIDELVALLGYDIQGEEDLRRYNKSLDGLEKKAYAVGMAIGRLGAIAGTAVAAGFSWLGKSVLDTSAKFETYLATLETIEGSSEKAKVAMDWVKDFAKTTPFEVDELTAAFVKLRSYGLDPMDGSMTVLGDTAAGMGKRIDQVVEAMADASTFQFERLRELGIVAAQSGDQVTFSWTENGKAMERTIKKTSSEVTKFLSEVWDTKFHGAMIRQSKTWTGMWSNMGDVWTDFQLRIGAAGFFDTVKNKLSDLMENVGRWSNDGTMDRIAKSLSNGFTAVADTLASVAERIARHVTFIMDNFEKFEPWLTTIGWGLALLAAWAFPAATVLALIGVAIDEILTYMEGGESIIGDFVKWVQDLTGASEGLAQVLAGIVVSLGLIAAMNAGKILRAAGGAAAATVGGGAAGTAAGAAGGGATAAGGGVLAGLMRWGAGLLALLPMKGSSANNAYADASADERQRARDDAILDAEIYRRRFEHGPQNGRGGLFKGDVSLRQGQQVPELGALISNLNANLAKMAGDAAAGATITDARQDNRSFPVDVNTTIHQTITTATQAPQAAASATAAAVNKAAQPSRMQTGSAF